MRRYTFGLLCLVAVGLALVGSAAHAQDEPPGVQMMTITRITPDPTAVPTVAIKTGDPKNPPPDVVFELKFFPAVIAINRLKSTDVQVETKGPDVVQAGNTSPGGKVTSVTGRFPNLTITLSELKGDGKVRIMVPSSFITDPAQPPAIRDEVPLKPDSTTDDWIRVDGTPPDVTVYEDPDVYRNRTLADPAHPDTDELIFFAKFIDESPAVTGFDTTIIGTDVIGTDVVINGAVYTDKPRGSHLWWWWDTTLLAAQFPSGAEAECRGVGVTVVPTPDPKIFEIHVFPRGDGPISVQVKSNPRTGLNPFLDPVPLDPIRDGPFVSGPQGPVPGWEANPSDILSDIQFTDAPRVRIEALNPHNTHERTLNFTVEFSKQVWDFGSGDVIVEPPTWPGVAGGTKTVLVSGSGEPGSEGQRYNVAVSGMTYSGLVRISLGDNAAYEYPLRIVNNHYLMNWPSEKNKCNCSFSENVCPLNWVNFDGTPPDQLTITLPAGLPQPPAYTGTYTTPLIKIDMAGTVHDDVAIASVTETGEPPVTWSNDRGGSGSCSGTTSWTARAIYLKPGRNNITITAHDAAGNSLSYLLVVNCTNSYWAETVQRPPKSGGQDIGYLGRYTSIALDGSGNPRIAYYYSLGDGAHGTLRYAAWDGQAWHTETVDGNAVGSGADDVGQFASLKLDADGNPHISYYDVTNKDLKYAVWKSGLWVSTIVDGTSTSADDVGHYSSLALYNGLPRIAYYDVANNKLKYASYNGTSWTRTLPNDIDSGTDVGKYASLALDPTTGNPRIAYYDATSNDLKYAQYSGSAWGTPTVVASTGDVGQYCSLAIDPTTFYPRVSYYDFTNNDLKYAAWDGAAWVVSTADAPGTVGQYTSLVLYNGLPRIAYYDAEATRQDLKLAEGSNGLNPTWTTTTLDDGLAEASVNTCNVGQYCALAVDAAGNPHVSYYDATIRGSTTNSDSALKYIFRAAGPTCVVDSLDPNPTNHSPLTFRIAFSTAVTGLTAGKVNVTLGTAGALTEIAPNDDTTYQLLVTPTSDGTVSVSVPFGAARHNDLDNQASNIAGVVVDRTPPTVKIDQDYIQRDPTNGATINFTVVFGEPVTGFTSDDVVLSGGAGGSKSVQVTGEGTTYNVAVTGMSLTAGTVVATVPAGGAFDAAGNGNYASTSTDNTVWWDGVRPTCAMNQAADQPDPTNSSVINFAAVFSEPVIFFNNHVDEVTGRHYSYDVTIGGTASFFGTGGTSTLDVVITPTGNPDAAGHYATYNVAVSGMQSRGTVTCTLNFGWAPPLPNQTPVPSAEMFPAYDTAPVPGIPHINRCITVTSTDNVVTYDATRPTCTINQKSDQPDPTDTQPIRYTVNFSKDVTGFTAGDVALTGTANLTNATKQVTGTGGNYTVEVSRVAVPAGQTGPGSVIANIPAGVVQDAAGNLNQAATFQDNSVLFDDRGPTVTVEQAAGQPDSTLGSFVHFTATFSEAVTGFAPEDVLLFGTSSDPTVQAIISIKPDGTFDPDTLIANHGDTIRWRNDGTSPFTLDILNSLSQTVATLDFAAGEVKSFTAFWGPGQYTFQKKVDIPLAVGMLTLNPVLTATVAQIPPNNGTTYDISVSGMLIPGTVTASVREGTAADALGNPNAASTSVDNTIVYFPERCATAHVLIPDPPDPQAPNGGVSMLDLTGFSGTIRDVNVKLTIYHNYDQDLTASLVGPDGTTVELFHHVGGNGSNFIDTVLDDEASQSIAGGPRAPFTGSFKPAGQLAAFDGKGITGQWLLKVVDDHGGVSGTIQSWCLQAAIEGTDKPVCTITPPIGSVCWPPPIDFAVGFSEPVVGLAASQFVVTGGTADALTGSAANYVLRVTPFADGKVEVTLPAQTAHDTCGNYNTDPAKGTFNYDGPPMVTINKAATQLDPTANTPINFTATFSKPVTGFATGDVTVTGAAFGPGATPVGTVTGSGANYNVAVTGMNQSGTVVAAIASGVARGLNGCDNLASVSTYNTVNYDITPVAVTINVAQGQPDPTTAQPINFVVQFSKPVSDFTASDVTVTGTAVGAKTVTLAGSGQNYTVQISGLTGAGTVIATIAAGKAHDALGNPNTASTSTKNTVWFDDNRNPEVTVTPAAGQADPTKDAPVNFTVTFNKIVNGFGNDPSDVTVEGTAFGATAVKGVVFTDDGGSWNVAVSGMTDPGTVILSVPASVACDLGGKCNNPSAPAQVVFDNVRPSVTINQAPGQPDPTDQSPINFTVEFSEIMNTEPDKGRVFDPTDVAVSGPALGAALFATVGVTGGPTIYNVTVSGMTTTGMVFATVVENAADDLAGNGSTASTSTDNGVNYDAPPTVTINQAASQADPTGTSPVAFTASFSEAVIGFGPTSVGIGGTAFGPGSTKNATVTGSGPVFTVQVSGMNQSGTIIVNIPAGVVKNFKGNDNLASTSTDNSVYFDITRPTVTIDQASTQADPTKDQLIKFTVVFSKPVVDFTSDDVTIGGTAGGAKTVTLTGSGTNYTIAVSGVTATGTVIASIADSAAHDGVGNGNLPSTSTDGVVTYDITGPTVKVNHPLTQADPTNVSPINFTVAFDEPVTDFGAVDVSIDGTAFGAGATKSAVVSGGPTDYNVAVSGMTTTGTVIASLAAGVAHDSLGNASSASTSTDNSVAFDNAGLTVTINQAATQLDPTKDSPISFTVVFSKPVADFTSDDVAITGTADGTKTVTVTGSGTTYTAAVTGMNSTGTVTAAILAGAAHDNAGNANAASTSTDRSVTYDITAPTITITKPTSDTSCIWNCGDFKIGGTADDSVALATVTWQTGKGGSGLCTGTNSWSASGIDVGGGDTVTVTVMDAAGNKATDSIDVSVTPALPAAADWTLLAMVALPIIPYDQDPKLQVGFSSDYWVSYKPDTGSYARYPSSQTWFTPPAKTPGRGFWAGWVGSSPNPPLPRGIVPDQTQPITLHLLPGWNLVGQPFIKAVIWSMTGITVKVGSQVKTLTDAKNLDWVKDYAWGWQPDPDPNNTAGGAYYLVCDPAVIAGATGEMAPWRAYWFKTNVECDLVLPAP